VVADSDRARANCVSSSNLLQQNNSSSNGEKQVVSACSHFHIQLHKSGKFEMHVNKLDQLKILLSRTRWTRLTSEVLQDELSLFAFGHVTLVLLLTLVEHAYIMT